jgi:signal transduction histidine kinase
MRRARGIRSRAFAAFAVFGGCVALLFFAVGHAATHIIEDRVSEHHLAIATEQARRFIEQHGVAPPPTEFSATYRGAAAVPAPLRARVAPLAPGYHELHSEGRELWVSHTGLATGGEPLFVVYDLPDSTFGVWRGAVAIGGLVILIGGLVIGAYTARRMARPLAELAELIHSTPPGRLGEALAGRRLDREVQLLADRLRAALATVEAHAGRDQRFTRYASHELRSPVAVVKGAAELLRITPEAEADRVRRPLERIERATADMEAIIEAFLWLAREGSAGAPPSLQALAPIVERVIDRYRHLLAGKPVEVRVVHGAHPRVAAPPAVIEVVLGNLVANAFHYTERGEVAIELGGHGLVVRDTGPGMSEHLIEHFGQSFVRGEKSVGYGLGLSIALSLCEQFGWQLTIESELGAGTSAALELEQRTA